jgi:hypothetical protein
MIRELVKRYETGAMTAHHLAVQCLHMVDPEEPDLVLAQLPDDILAAIDKFAVEYDPRGMNTNFGVIPAQDQVTAAMKWIDAKGINFAKSK